MPVPKNCVFFIGCNFESRASQVGVHQQKKDCASAKAGKVSLLRREGQSQGCALTYGARSPKATKTWPRAMKKLSRSAQPGGMLVLVSWFSKVKKLEFITCNFVGRSAASRLKRTFRSLTNSWGQLVCSVSIRKLFKRKCSYPVSEWGTGLACVRTFKDLST